MKKFLVNEFAVDATFTEAYRVVRTALLAKLDPTQKCVVVTSNERGEGKSLTCSNLGIIASQAGLKTVIVDADFRIAAQHIYFDVPPGRYAQSLLDPFCTPSTVKTIAKEAPVNIQFGLDLLPAGDGIDNPSELIGSKQFTQLLNELSSTYDLVLVDTPPVGLVTDGISAASIADGAILVVDFERRQRDEVQVAVERLKKTGTPLLGVIVNRVKGKSRAHEIAYGRQQ